MLRPPERPLLPPTSFPPGILLVEDNPLDARATMHAARELDLGTPIRLVSDGRAALEYLRARSQPTPNLVLLDLNLAGMDGHDVLAEIRSDPRLRLTPVVVLTSSDDGNDVAAAYLRGANAYVTKPVELDDWLRVMATIHDFWLSVARLPVG